MEIRGRAHAPEPMAGSNRGSFKDQEVDRLHDLVLASVKPEPRRQAEVALHRRMSEILPMGPIYYPVDVVMSRNNVKGPIGHYTYPATSWNVFEWEVAE